MRGLPWPVAEVACGRERLQPSCRVCACGVVCTCVAWVFFFVLGVLCACVCTRMRGSLRGVSCFSIPSPSSRAMSSGHRGRKRETEVVAEAKKNSTPCILHFVVCKTCPLSYQYFFPSCTIVCTRVFLNGIRLAKSLGEHRLRWQERGRRGVIDIGVSARSSVCKLFVQRLGAHITLKTRTVSCDMTSSQDFSCD